MSKTTPAKYVRQKVREIALIELPTGRRAFQAVGRMGSIDVERINKIPGFPKAIITQLGGELNSVNGEIWTKRLGVTVVLMSANDAFLDEVSNVMDEYTEMLIDKLEHSREDDSIMAIYQSEDQAVPRDGMTDVLFKTIIFQYKIDRVVAEE